MNKEYRYVGPENLLDLLNSNNKGSQITNLVSLSDWIECNKQMISYGELTATFIISKNHHLLINDRHSEHVVCANGENVLSAGEITFSVEEKVPYVSAITNQSTGYCPEVGSWKVVEEVLRDIGIDFPDYFTSAFEFRYCTNCDNTNIVKDDYYCCVICGADLALDWNYDEIE